MAIVAGEVSRNFAKMLVYCCISYLYPAILLILNAPGEIPSGIPLDECLPNRLCGLYT